MKHTSRKVIVPLVLALAVVCISCQSQQDEPGTTAAPGGMITVEILGDVAQSGSYELPAGSSVKDLLAISGGFRRKSWGPAEMKLKRRKEDGHESTYSLSGSNDWQDVELEDGDEVWFPIVVF